jgi:hypothetical protein
MARNRKKKQSPRKKTKSAKQRVDPKRVKADKAKMLRRTAKQLRTYDLKKHARNRSQYQTGLFWEFYDVMSEALEKIRETIIGRVKDGTYKTDKDWLEQVEGLGDWISRQCDAVKFELQEQFQCTDSDNFERLAKNVEEEE